MAMTMSNQVYLEASPELVWEKLNDPEVLSRCIPGCQSLEQTEDGGFAAVVKVAFGPIKATFKGSVQLTDLNPPISYKIVGKGEGGLAGFASGDAVVGLTSEGQGTRLSYDVTANIGGKIAQLGARLINNVSAKLAEQFFNQLAETIETAKAV